MNADHGALAHYLRCYDDDLDAALCAQLVASFNGLARFQRGNGRGVRAGLEDSAWTELDISPLSDTAFRGFLMSRIDANLERYNREVGLRIAVPAAQRTSELIIKRYRPGGEEQFQLHFDSIGAVANRYLVFLWYLNDVTDGGETRFPDLGISVQPRAGRLLMFPPYWMYQHEAPPPLSGDKYILSTYLLF
ncbi:MAG: 2OG-Fe(II) oxygenase [Rhodanobacteraceae bacterium]|nr:2OG-Fe(II) oxygenase [Rhodanobacteraceae bacterium]